MNRMFNIVKSMMKIILDNDSMSIPSCSIIVLNNDSNNIAEPIGKRYCRKPERHCNSAKNIEPHELMIAANIKPRAIPIIPKY